jgi:hypothetical protein
MTGRNYTALGYCDETDIENFLLLDIDRSFSEQVEDWIAAAELHVNKYIGHTTASGVLLETITNENAAGRIDSESNLIVFPRKIPIVSVQGITLVKGTSTIELELEDGSGNTRYNLPPANDYLLYPNQELSISGASIISSFSEIKTVKFFSQIDYVGGYAVVPADIRMATVNLASDMVMRHANKEGLESITQGRVSKRWRQRYFNEFGESDFILDAYKLLDHYRIASRWI